MGSHGRDRHTWARVRQSCTNHKAIALADGSTGVHVSGNRVNPRIGKLVTFDDEDVALGYVGLPPDN
jgi:hypothetical protein